jgi:hypothetical protein
MIGDAPKSTTSNVGLGFGLHAEPETGTTAIDAARRRWQDSRDLLQRLGLSDRTGLARALRREAVLLGARANLEAVGWSLLVTGGLFLVAPVLVIQLMGIPWGVGALLLTYGYHVMIAFVLVLVVLFAFFTLGDFLEDHKGWVHRVLQLLAAGLLVAALGTYVLYAVRTHSTFHAAVLSGLLLFLVLSLLLPLELALTARQKSRRVGALAPGQAAAVVFVRIADHLVSHRATWRRPSVRRRLVAELTQAAEGFVDLLDRSVRLAGGRRDARDWAAERAWHLSRCLRAHGRDLLQATSQPRFDAIISRLGEQATALADGSWDPVEQEGEPAVTPRAARRLLRILPAVVLLGVAFGIGYIPGLAGASLLTIRLSLAIPALLSLIPADRAERDLMLNALRDAVSKVR